MGLFGYCGCHFLPLFFLLWLAICRQRATWRQRRIQNSSTNTLCLVGCHIYKYRKRKLCWLSNGETEVMWLCVSMRLSGSKNQPASDDAETRCLNLTKRPPFCPRPCASSAVLTLSHCVCHAAPSLSAAESHPRPRPVCFTKPVGNEAKAWRQLFFPPASLFQTRDLIHRLRDGTALYGASGISACGPHNGSSGPRNNADMTTQKAKQADQSTFQVCPQHITHLLREDLYHTL